MEQFLKGDALFFVDSLTSFILIWFKHFLDFFLNVSAPLFFGTVYYFFIKKNKFILIKKN